MKLIKYLLLVIVIISFSSCLTDLRTEFNHNQGYSDSLFVKGRKLLLSVYKKSNLETVKNSNGFTVTYSDEFLNFKGVLANPYKDKTTRMELNLSPESFNGRITFLDGKEKGVTYGLLDDKTYFTKNNNTRYKKSKRTKFWLPTYHYFIEFPRLILDADKITYAGEQTFNSKQYDLVLASWKTFEPQRKLDQYLIWISKKTGRIEILQYTIRDYYGCIEGVAFMEDYKLFSGVLLPATMRVKSGLNQKKLMHIMHIENLEINYAIE